MFGDMKFTFPALLLLPVEMWATILRYLDDKTLLSAALTSKRFMRVCKGDPILRKRVRAQILLERRLLRNATLDREMGITVIRNYAPNVINVNQNKTVAKKYYRLEYQGRKKPRYKLLHGRHQGSKKSRWW
ncbi:hypothetical protein FQA39_LY19329 [Lamprigera yunnana]|nr:hypothetical protein FQA39_LY19329 [Lamprigera yunnana]